MGRLCLKLTLFFALVASGYNLVASNAFAAAPSLNDISVIIPGPVFGLFKYIENFDFSFGFAESPKTIPGIVESIPKTKEEARGFFFTIFQKIWGLIKGVGSFLYSMFQSFSNWLADILGLPEKYTPWRR